MKRILYITDYLFAGGIEALLVDLVLGLDRKRFEPHVVCLYGPRARNLHFAPVLQEADVPLHLLDLQFSPPDKLQGIISIAQSIRAIKPDIAQAENYHANLLLRLARPFYRDVRIITTVKTVYTAKQLFYERLGRGLSTKMVVNAPHLKRLLEYQSGYSSNKVLTIPNGIDVKRFATPRDDTLRRRIAPSARRLLVTVGRISHEKNMHVTIQALGLLKRDNRLPQGTSYLIVGPVHQEIAQQQLEEAVHHDALEDVVIQHGATSYTEDYYHAGDVTVLYSPSEGLPNVVLESLAAGRPVIVSERANAASIIEHGITGWVVPNNDVRALAETLHYALTLPDSELTAMRSNCIAVAQLYSTERMVNQFMELYEML